MKKVREICSSPWFLIAAQIVLSGAIAVGAVFYTRIMVIDYRAWKCGLIYLTFAVCGGGLAAITYFEKHPDAKVLQLIFSFAIGFGGLLLIDFLMWLFLLRINLLRINTTLSSVITISVILATTLALVITQDVFAIRRDRKFLRLVTVAFIGAVYVGAMFLSCLMLPHGWVFKSFSKNKHLFATASAEAYRLTDADRNAGKSWLLERLAGESPAFDFRLEGRRFTDNLSSWNAVTVTSETDGEGNVTLVRTYTHASGVEARVEGKYYDVTATVEWTVYVTNRGSERSAILSDLHPLEAAFPISSPTLYFSGGSNEANDDFALYSRKLGKREYVFDTVDGRTSSLYLPFFNLSASDRGATLGIGWSGQWTATFSGGKSTKVCVGQSALEGYLDPGETVRSPLVSLCLYEGGNALKGFNAFRADIKRGLGDKATESSMLMFAGAEGQDDTSKANAAGTKAYVEALASAGILDTLDYAWFDAGWYDTSKTGEWRASVGDWTADAAKYPEGLGAVSDYLKQNGVKTLLWYEPERVPMTSDLYKTISATAGCESWLIRPTNGSADCLWNMGDHDALSYMTEYIASSLIQNGVSYYRQDFNIEPKTYWERADRELYDDRTGFAENKYVTGEYAFLDALMKRIPDLKIDNCASGGRRIDLEMCRRSVPLWRSDYQCKKEKNDLSEAAQYQSYGLGMWLPYSCVTNPNASSEYDFRSLLGGYVMCYGDIVFDAKDAYVKFIREYEQIKTYFAQNYYPLTPGTLDTRVAAMQYGSESEGIILTYVRSKTRRARNKDTVYPNGLSSEKSYEFRLLDGDVIKIGSGKELMKNGITLSTDHAEAIIITYREA